MSKDDKASAELLNEIVERCAKFLPGLKTIHMETEARHVFIDEITFKFQPTYEGGGTELSITPAIGVHTRSVREAYGVAIAIYEANDPTVADPPAKPEGE